MIKRNTTAPLSAAQHNHHPCKEDDQSTQAHIGAGDSVPESGGAHFPDKI